MDTTIQYYNTNADKFASGTVDVEFAELQERFLAKMPAGALILDFGCGSGRDTKYFLKRGFSVEATDGSIEMCRIAADYAGVPVKQLLFSELAEQERYDGVWACSSILHLPKPELQTVLRKIADALKLGGVFYTSFKYSEFEGMRNGRYFTDFTEEGFLAFVKQIPQLCVEESWVTGDVRPGRGEERWLNLLLRKTQVS